MKTDKKLLSLAYHEAAHAVAAFLYGFGLKYATIIPDKKRGSLGHVRVTSRKVNNIEFAGREDEGFYREYLIFTLAGWEAEKKLCGRYSHIGAGSDFQHVKDIIFRNQGALPQKAIDGYFQYVRYSTKHFIETNWDKIIRVADNLLQYRMLTGEEIRNILLWGIKEEHQWDGSKFIEQKS